MADLLGWRRKILGQEVFLPEIPELDAPIQIPEPERPMMEAYRQRLQEQPKLADYKMSRTRNILGRIAGGLAGLGGDPKTAASVNRSIRYAPYMTQQAQYQQELEQAKNLAGMEDADIKARVDRMYREAQGRELRSRAERNIAAAAAEERRNRGYVPTTEEEAIRLNQSRVTPPAPPQPKTFFDPQRGVIVVAPPGAAPVTHRYADPRPGPETPEQRLAREEKLAKIREEGALGRTKYRETQVGQRQQKSLEARKTEMEAGTRVSDQSLAEWNAAIKVAKDRPDLGFEYNPQTKSVDPPKPSMLGGWFGTLSKEQVAAKQEEFDRLVEAEKQRIIRESKARPRNPPPSEDEDEWEEIEQ